MLCDFDREYKERLFSCERCGLYRYVRNKVMGSGGFKKKIMLVGEAPGRMEDLYGKPFVGASGKFLDELLKEAGLTRSDVWITNVVKCRPPNNRNPLADEIDACKWFLLWELKCLKPKVVVVLGSVAMNFFLGNKCMSVTRCLGGVFRGRVGGLEFPVFVSYHPAVALYDPGKKGLMKRVFRDFGVWLKNNVLEARSDG